MLLAAVLELPFSRDVPLINICDISLELPTGGRYVGFVALAPSEYSLKKSKRSRFVVRPLRLGNWAIETLGVKDDLLRASPEARKAEWRRFGQSRQQKSLEGGNPLLDLPRPPVRLRCPAVDVGLLSRPLSGQSLPLRGPLSLLSLTLSTALLTLPFRATRQCRTLRTRLLSERMPALAIPRGSIRVRKREEASTPHLVPHAALALRGRSLSDQGAGEGGECSPPAPPCSPVPASGPLTASGTGCWALSPNCY
jgi:hypothetical protein